MKSLVNLLGVAAFMTVIVTVLTYLWNRCRLWWHRRVPGMGVWGTSAICFGVVVLSSLVFYFVDHIGWLQEALGGKDLKFLKVFLTPVYPDIPDLTGSGSQVGDSAAPVEEGDENIPYHFANMFFAMFGYLIFAGFFVSLFVNLLQNKIRSIDQGEESYSHLRNHYVVIGSGVFLVPVLEDILDDCATCGEGKKAAVLPDVLVLTREPIPELRKRISAQLPGNYYNKLIFIHGDRTNREDLEKLCLPNCREIFLMGDYREPDQDDRNLETLTLMNALMHEYVTEGNPQEKKTCRIFLERYHTYILFLGVFKNVNFDHLYVEPISIHKKWAEMVLGNRVSPAQNVHYLPLDRGGIAADSPNFVHLVVIGMSRMGMSLVTEAALQLHFPNADAQHRTRITMIDIHARREMNSYVNLHENLFRHAYYTYTEYADEPLGVEEPVVRDEKNRENAWLDTEFHFVQGDAESLSLRKLLQSFVEEKNAYLTVAVCLPDPRRALTLAMSFPQSFYRASDGAGDGIAPVSVLVQQEVGYGLLSLLAQQAGTQYGNVKPFGMLNGKLELSQTMDPMTPYMEPCLYVWNCKREQSGKELKMKAIANRKAKLQDMMRWKSVSNHYSAITRAMKLRCIGTSENASFYNLYKCARKGRYDLAKVEHNRWCMEKFYVGYRPLSRDEEQRLLQTADQQIRENLLTHYKNDLFAHVALRPWQQIVDDPARFSSYFYNSVNMGWGICVLPELVGKVAAHGK